ncbi:hypothetical protein AA0472_1953 [Acetobacter estunensis NRIC 0472]|uniref:DUF4043 domain-containing protein n=1 Tax=Acetobacter estunensis TaxID=104097 RepID=A0A967B565_9PROT|nr:DUF4043 domain-containing protein [Acetobacter estunensis]NHO52436.1 DUF4043 domain-containing protein [Acetobacter estunensis]GBQ25982.1 hypothetical protein AA0472_1953 [Acetobacter estunensis NRIC 0472]
MTIDNFPSQLQPIIQQGYLAREFSAGLQSRIAFRAIADREVFPNRVGETITKTRKGLKSPVTTPMNPSQNVNFDNGLTPSTWSVEQYTLTINQYGDTIDLNVVSEGVGIADQFLANANTNGIQALQSLDRIARNALFGGGVGGVGGYMGGNTCVTTALGSSSTQVAVDDIRGFERLVNSTGQVVSVAQSAGMTVTIGSNAYTLVSVTADSVNTSTAPLGQSGTLTLSTSVSVSDGAAGSPVVSSTAPLVLRPNNRLTTAQLVAPTGNYGSSNYVTGDTLGIQTVLAAVAALRMNNVPTIDGAYHCYLDDQQMLGLFRDGDFKYLYRGAYGSDTYRAGSVVELLGVRFIPTTEAPLQASLGAGVIHRAIVCGQGALIEGDYSGALELPDSERSLVENVDGIMMVTREPLDRLKQMIAQSWYWIGGFALPTDATVNPTIIPTSTNSYLKRGVVIESL